LANGHLISAEIALTCPPVRPDYIIGLDKKSRQGRGYPKLYQTFEACFNELLFISIALKLLQILNKFDGNLIFLAKCGSNDTTADPWEIHA
jgi:hypothetical protein